VRPLELVEVFNTGIVRAKSFDALLAFLLGKEAGCGDVVVKLPVNEGSCDNGNKSTEKENSVLILVKYLC
jgi:hypothetical protein